MKRNCKDCLYSNFNEDGSVDCDKKLLSDGMMIHIEVDNVELPCPAHSSVLIHEIRYMHNNKYIYDDGSGQYCEVCRRKVNLDEIDQYEYIDIHDETGKVIGDKMICKICKGKGRR